MRGLPPRRTLRGFCTPTSTGGGGSGTPMVSITSPTACEIFKPGSTVTLQASPVTGAGTITSVTFYDSTAASNNNVIGTATSSPWSVQWANVPAGSYSLTAVASNGSESLTSYPVAITVEAPTVVVNPTNVAVQQGKSTTFGVALSAQPASTVTVTVAQNSGGDPDLSVSSGGTLTFTTSNWSVPQTVTVASGTTGADGGSQGTFSASATGYNTGTVTVTEALAAGSQSGYDQWFLNLYDTIMNPVNGYFSPKGIPYHSVETLIVEAPDYGHETTSETYSYYLWLTADYGRVTGNWTPFNNAWANMQQYMIPNDANQPGQCTYNASSPAQYGPEEAVPSDYPVALNSSVPVGSDPLFAELKSTYGNCDMYQPMWIMDTDNRYGFGQQEDGSSTPSWVNSYQRGPEESVWDTIPQPDWDTFKYGGPNGFLDLFNNGGGSFAQQYKYTDAPDADARMVQAAYWADTYAKAQGKQSQIATTLADAAKLGDFLRYSMFDKYFKQISANCSQQGSVACPAGTSKANEDTYLLSWYDAWGGATNGAWSWRISGTTIHEGYQNPLAAYALSTDSNLIPLSPTAKGDWATSLITQLNMYKWLQSAEGGIAGGIDEQLGRQLRRRWQAAHRGPDVRRHVLRPPAGVPQPAVQPVVRLPDLADGAPRRVLLRDRQLRGTVHPRQVGELGRVGHHGEHQRRHDLPARHAHLVRSARRELDDRHLEHDAATGQHRPARVGVRLRRGPRRGHVAGQGLRVLRGQGRRHDRGNRRAEHPGRHPQELRRPPGLLRPRNQDRLQELHLALQHDQLRGRVLPAELDRQVPGRDPAQLVHQHLPVDPALVHR